MFADSFDQQGFRCRFAWGRHGVRQAAARGDVLVIVDVLSFATVAATAIQHGGLIYPCAEPDVPRVLAERIGGVAAVGRSDVPGKGRFSLSPLTYINLEPGSRIVVASPNGATCSRYAGVVPYLFVGALINARAVAQAVTCVLDTTDLDVTVIAAGERWPTPTEDGALRFAIEDQLGAGAILSYLSYEKSPEARVSEAAFLGVRDNLSQILWDCGSGRELRERGFGDDVRHAAQLNRYAAVPIMRGERLEAWAD